MVSPFGFPLTVVTKATTTTVMTNGAVLLGPSGGAPMITTGFIRIVLRTNLPGNMLGCVPKDKSRMNSCLISRPGAHFMSFAKSHRVNYQVCRQTTGMRVNRV